MYAVSPGATADSSRRGSTHLALEVPGEEASNEWLEPVDNEEYLQTITANRQDPFLML